MDRVLNSAQMPWAQGVGRSNRPAPTIRIKAASEIKRSQFCSCRFPRVAINGLLGCGLAGYFLQPDLGPCRPIQALYQCPGIRPDRAFDEMPTNPSR